MLKHVELNVRIFGVVTCRSGATNWGLTYSRFSGSTGASERDQGALAPQLGKKGGKHCSAISFSSLMWCIWMLGDDIDLVGGNQGWNYYVCFCPFRLKTYFDLQETIPKRGQVFGPTTECGVEEDPGPLSYKMILETLELCIMFLCN